MKNSFPQIIKLTENTIVKNYDAKKLLLQPKMTLKEKCAQINNCVVETCTSQAWSFLKGIPGWKQFYKLLITENTMEFMTG